MKNYVKVVLLFCLLFDMQLINYAINDFSFLETFIYSILDLIVYSISLMIVPIIMLLCNGKKFDKEKGKKICRTNSIIVWLIMIVISSALKISGINISFNVGWIGAIVYYFINYFITTETETTDEQVEILK